MAATGHGGNEAYSSCLFEEIAAGRVRQIVIEFGTPSDFGTTFRLCVGDNPVADDLTAAQAHYLVGEALDQIAFPKRSEATAPTMEADAALKAAGPPNRPASWRRNSRSSATSWRERTLGWLCWARNEQTMAGSKRVAL